MDHLLHIPKQIKPTTQELNQQPFTLWKTPNLMSYTSQAQCPFLGDIFPNHSNPSSLSTQPIGSLSKIILFT